MLKTQQKKGTKFFYLSDTQGGIKSVGFVTAFMEGQCLGYSRYWSESVSMGVNTELDLEL